MVDTLVQLCALLWTRKCTWDAIAGSKPCYAKQLSQFSQIYSFLMPVLRRVLQLGSGSYHS